MSSKNDLEPMLELFYFETSQCLADLEQLVLGCEKNDFFDSNTIGEIFRIMHNIKSSAAMMLFNHISNLAHTVEDLFFFLREKQPTYVDYPVLSDLVLAAADFIKIELDKIINSLAADGDNSILINDIKDFLAHLEEGNQITAPETPPNTAGKVTQFYISRDTSISLANLNIFKSSIMFQDGCEMENIRAYAIVHHLKDLVEEIYYIPNDIMENDDTANFIRENGFKMWFKTSCDYKEMSEFFQHTAFVRDLELFLLEDDAELKELRVLSNIGQDHLVISPAESLISSGEDEKLGFSCAKQSMISVNVDKLDILMDLVGEMVIAEAMVTHNPDLKDLQLDNFKKSALQLRKITSEVQDVVMSIRMVPLTITLQKMNRIVRDMARKLNKDVDLEIIGAETEVDKNIIEHISDPLMHLVRNAVDHGLESDEERISQGKTDTAKVIIEARSAGQDVLITVKDNGRGLDKEKILTKAINNGLINKAENDLTDKEI